MVKNIKRRIKEMTKELQEALEKLVANYVSYRKSPLSLECFRHHILTGSVVDVCKLFCREVAVHGIINNGKLESFV
jgi:hypothetical protein